MKPDIIERAKRWSKLLGLCKEYMDDISLEGMLARRVTDVELEIDDSLEEIEQLVKDADKWRQHKNTFELVNYLDGTEVRFKKAFIRV